MASRPASSIVLPMTMIVALVQQQVVMAVLPLIRLMMKSQVALVKMFRVLPSLPTALPSRRSIYLMSWVHPSQFTYFLSKGRNQSPIP